MSAEKITHAEYLRRIDAQGVEPVDMAVVCVMCGTVQSPRSFERAGVPRETIRKQIGFSCVGRHTGAGPHKEGAAPGRGCDWTLGGLFTLHTLEVELDDGKLSPAFHVATPEQARALAQNPRP